MIVFQKKTTKKIPAGIRTIVLLMHLLDALSSALSGHNTFWPKQSNREKIVQEQLNDEKTINKRRFLITKKRRKKRQKNNKKTTISYNKKTP